jgi:sigma-B regulation protein RsbU (phosphoserine phosphatase)
MSRTGTSILIVDDAKFSSAVVNKTLVTAGFTDIRAVNNAPDALKVLEQRPASIVIADWLMPEMDGLELTRRIRQIDESANRYTYVILLTAKEGVEALVQAFDEGVDDFVNKSAMQQQLVPRVLAAERVTSVNNRLLAENQQLLEQNRRLKTLSTLDPITGLGNRAYAVKRVADALRHAQLRGGAACYLLITIRNYADLEKKMQRPLFAQLVAGVARRLRQLVRPLDIVVRVNANQFALVTHQPDIVQCTPASFRRLMEGINGKEFKTQAGFVPIRCAVTLVAADLSTGFPEPDAIMVRAEQLMPKAHETGLIIAEPWKQPANV